MIKFAAIGGDVLADDLHGLGVVAVVAHGQHMSEGVAFALTAGSDMEVISGVARLLATGTDVAAHMALVRTLVGAETDVAIDAVGAVLGLQAADTVVERLYTGDEACRNLFKTFDTTLIDVFVFHKPGTLVVAAQLTQKGYYFFHG